MERNLKVTGTGKIAVKPDLIRIIVTQTAVLKNYEDAIRESGEKKAQLVEELLKVGFKKEDVKTLQFNLSTEYENYQDKDKSWKNRLVGYRYNHQMNVKFPVDNARLGKVLSAVAASASEPEFSIQYTLSKPDDAKNQLIAQAVADSKIKAEVLAKAAGVQLGEVQNIDYSWNQVELVSRPVNAMLYKARGAANDCAESSLAMDIEADDIKVTDTVTVVWCLN